MILIISLLVVLLSSGDRGTKHQRELGLSQRRHGEQNEGNEHDEKRLLSHAGEVIGIAGDASGYAIWQWILLKRVCCWLVFLLIVHMPKSLSISYHLSTPSLGLFLAIIAASPLNLAPTTDQADEKGQGAQATATRHRHHGAEASPHRSPEDAGQESERIAENR